MDIKELIFGNKKVKLEAKGIYKNSIQEFLPILDIKDGVIITKDGRYVKIMEVLPVNFYLKSVTEQQNIIYYFSSYLKIAPNNLQIRVFTQKADINAYANRMWVFYDNEENDNCREMIQDNVNMVHYLAHSEAVTRRFFLIFQLEPHMKLRGGEYNDIVTRLNEEADTARKYLDYCGLEIVEWDEPDQELIKLFFNILNKKSAKNGGFPKDVLSMLGEVAFFDGGGADGTSISTFNDTDNN